MSILDVVKGAASAAVSGASSWLSVAGAALGLGKAVAEDIGKSQDAAKSNELRNEGTTSQRETTNESELNAIRDDRVRGASDKLRERTASDHGIVSDP